MSLRVFNCLQERTLQWHCVTVCGSVRGAERRALSGAKRRAQPFEAPSVVPSVAPSAAPSAVLNGIACSGVAALRVMACSVALHNTKQERLWYTTTKSKKESLARPQSPACEVD